MSSPEFVTIDYLKMMIASLSKDIRSIKEQMDVIQSDITWDKAWLARYLDDQDWESAKVVDKQIKRNQKTWDKLESAMKTIETIRLPYHNDCIKIKMHIANARIAASQYGFQNWRYLDRQEEQIKIITEKYGFGS